MASARHKRLSSDQSNANSTAQPNRSSHAGTETSESEELGNAPWKALFYFTTRANIPLLVAGVTFSIAAGAAVPANAYIVGKFIDGFSEYATGKVDPDEFARRETAYVVYLVALASGVWLVCFLELSTWMAFGELQAKSARDRLFYGLLDRDIEWYDMRKNGIGAMLPRMQAQIRDLQLSTSQPLGQLITLISTATLSLVQALVRAWDLTLVTIASVPFLMIAIVWAGKKIQLHYEKQQNVLTEAQKYASSAFGAIETVKCYNGQEIEKEKYMVKAMEAAGWYYRVAHATAIQMALIALLTVSMFVQGFYYGSVLVSSGKSTTGDIVTTFFSAIGAFQAIASIMPQLAVFEKGRTAGGTLRAVMAQVHQGPNVRRRSGILAPATCHGDIEVRDLTFAYPARPLQPALKDVTMFIPGGNMTFLIGKSGSGKSTLGQLLLRFYTSSSGHISLDGVPLNSLDVNWLRTNVTLVEQTSLLFNDTVARNIALGRKDHQNVTKEEIVAATEFALLQLMINDMPHGIETVVGHKGGGMSGGQRQRMALARARLRDTPILLLDESTSALDHVSRGLMMDAIRHWRQGKTTIIITHDISQILADDYVFVLEQGRMVQEGFRKHMERMKDTPFQGFLPEELRATISPYDDRKNTGYDTVRTRGTSLDSASEVFSNIAFDPMEAHLDAGEVKRASFFPRVFTEGSPFPVARTNAGGAVSAFSSPWGKLAAANPPSSSPNSQKGTPGGLRWSGFFGKKPEIKSPLSAESGVSHSRWSKIMETVIDRTGQVAAESRAAPAGTRRRREAYLELKSISELGTSEVKLATEEDREESGAPPSKSYKEILKTVWPSIDWSSRTVLVIGFVGATVHAGITPSFSYLLSKLLALYNIPGGDKQKALTYSMIMLGLAFIDATATYIFKFFLEYSSQRWVDCVRSKAIHRILDQPRAFFEKDENAVPHLAGSLDRNAEEMRNLVGRFISLIWIAVMTCVIALIWCLVSQWKLMLISLCAAPYVFGVTKAFAAISLKWEGRANAAAEDASAIFTETFNNIRTVRALTLEDHFRIKYIEATKQTLRVGFRRSFYSGIFFGLADSAGEFATALVFYVGTRLVRSGTSVDDVLLVFTLLIFTIENVSAILAYIPQMGSSQDTACRILRLAELPEDSHEHLGDTRITVVGEVVFDDLQFSYPSRPEQTILKHINLHIHPGTTVAVVGGSGSGKSTIANLLLNLYGTASLPGDAYRRAGDLMLAGRDIKHIFTPSLRALVVPVSQTPTLFAATVSENIAYGLTPDSPYNNQTCILAAAAQAGVDEFVSSLPQGYSTLIGDGGMGLSGGQAQRVAIARALVRKPAVLILDEATSALDVESANLVRQTIESLVRDKSRAMTVVIITHSRDMMEIAERIVVLDGGRIVEEGGFNELMGKPGALSMLLSGGEWTEDKAGQSAGGRIGGVPILGEINWKKKRGGGARRRKV